jgi:arylsulfatase A-like enzyme
MKRLLGALAVAVAAVVVGFFAVGGREGIILLYVKHWMRSEAGPTQEVRWQAGPAAAPAVAPGTRRPPNIVLIVADDLGFNDVSLHGGGIANGAVPTPHIDSIARNGVEFTAGYAGNATCAPSRAAMVTGRYATRVGFEFTPVPLQFQRVVGRFKGDALRRPIYHAEREAASPRYEDMGLPPSEITIASLLKGAGYHTIHLGKWHLGESPQFRPNAHGFAESLGFLPAASMFLPSADAQVVNSKQDFDPIDRFLWAAEPWAVRFNDSALFKPARYMTDYLTDEAVRAIQANRNRPFLMYLAYNAPHTPLQATREDYDALSQIPDHTLRVYGAMVRSLDRNVGRVLEALKANGLEQDTLVVFTSDNGGAHYIGLDGLNRPYRGWKATFFEGGIRVPFYMSWPGVVAKGATYAAPVSHFDIFATAAAAAGTPLPKDRVIDGVDLLPYVTGASSGRPHEQLFWRSGPYRVVRSGDWKLQVTETPAQDWLYNIKDDPGERTNLAAAQPARVAELKARLAAFEREQAQPLWPALIEAPITLDKPLGRPQSHDDAYVYWSN